MAFMIASLSDLVFRLSKKDGTEGSPKVSGTSMHSTFNHACHLLEISNKRFKLCAARFVILCPKNRRRMHGGDHVSRKRRLNQLSPLATDPEILAQQRLGGTRA